MAIRLNVILRAHEAYADNTSLPQVFGDGYLYVQSSIFRNVRDAFQGAGFGFSTEDYCNYASSALMSLPTILKERRIPVFDTVSVLRKLETGYPKAFGINEVLNVAKLELNHVLHESAHCVAETLLPTVKLSKIASNEPLDTKAIVGVLLRESFALSVELFSCLEALRETHRVFLHCNAYVSPYFSPQFRAPMASLRRSVELLGFSRAFLVQMLASTHAQFLRAEISSRDLGRMLEAVGFAGKLDAADRHELSQAVSMRPSQLLEPQSRIFYTRTASFYFKHAFGFQGDLRDLLGFDFLAVLDQTSELRAGLGALASVIEQGTAHPGPATAGQEEAGRVPSNAA